MRMGGKERDEDDGGVSWEEGVMEEEGEGTGWGRVKIQVRKRLRAWVKTCVRRKGGRTRTLPISADLREGKREKEEGAREWRGRHDASRLKSVRVPFSRSFVFLRNQTRRKTGEVASKATHQGLQITLIKLQHPSENRRSRRSVQDGEESDGLVLPSFFEEAQDSGEIVPGSPRKPAAGKERGRPKGESVSIEGELGRRKEMGKKASSELERRTKSQMGPAWFHLDRLERIEKACSQSRAEREQSQRREQQSSRRRFRSSSTHNERRNGDLIRLELLDREDAVVIVLL